jgi:hypothetical protein
VGQHAGRGGRYRIGGGGGYPSNAYGQAITAYLDGWRVNMERLAEINKKYNTQAIFHTQGALGMPLWDLMYVWRNIDPKYVVSTIASVTSSRTAPRQARRRCSRTTCAIVREGGYNGLFDTQEEYTITGTDGSSVSLNAAWFADNAVFTSGRVTPALLISTMKQDMDYYKTQAKAAGWTSEQLTPA